MNNIAQEYLNTTIKRLKFYKDLGDRSFINLDTESFHYQANEVSNSIAMIIKHLSGNMLSRWTNFLTEDGEKEWRDRDGEFECKNLNKDEILKMWQDGWDCFFNALENLTEEDLLKTVYIRKEGLGVIDAINRQLSHYPYHIGQIVYIAKLIQDKNWKSLSIAKGESQIYNSGDGVKDPAKKF